MKNRANKIVQLKKIHEECTWREKQLYELSQSDTATEDEVEKLKTEYKEWGSKRAAKLHEIRKEKYPWSLTPDGSPRAVRLNPAKLASLPAVEQMVLERHRYSAFMTNGGFAVEPGGWDTFLLFVSPIEHTEQGPMLYPMLSFSAISPTPAANVENKAILYPMPADLFAEIPLPEAVPIPATKENESELMKV